MPSNHISATMASNAPMMVVLTWVRGRSNVSDDGDNLNSDDSDVGDSRSDGDADCDKVNDNICMQGKRMLHV